MYACDAGDSAMIELLLDSGANPNTQSGAYHMCWEANQYNTHTYMHMTVLADNTCINCW